MKLCRSGRSATTAYCSNLKARETIGYKPKVSYPQFTPAGTSKGGAAIVITRGPTVPNTLRFCYSHSPGMQNQISKEHRRFAAKPLELASIEFKRRCQDGALPPLKLKRGGATRPQNEFVNECLRRNSRPGNLSPRLYQPDSVPYRNEIRYFRYRNSYDPRLR